MKNLKFDVVVAREGIEIANEFVEAENSFEAADLMADYVEDFEKENEYYVSNVIGNEVERKSTKLFINKDWQ